MVSPVQFTNNQRVFFRGENDDLINAKGEFQQAAVPETPADEVVLSSQETPEKKKGGFGKTLLKSIGALVVTAGALFGLFKWKGAKWLNPAAEGKMDKFKHYLVKPGEWMETKGKALLEKCGIGKAKPQSEFDDIAEDLTAEI